MAELMDLKADTIKYEKEQLQAEVTRLQIKLDEALTLVTELQLEIERMRKFRVGRTRMKLQYKIAIAAISLLAAFAAGRYSVSQPSIHTVVDTNTKTNTDTDTNKHETTVTTVVEQPNGTKTTTTKTTENDTIDQTQNQDTVSEITQTVTAPKKNTLNISALAGLDLSNSMKPVYGASVNKNFLGPVTMGVFGLTNGTVGVSLGLSF